jgi:hypothetical protein
MKRLENVALKTNVFEPFSRFETLLRGFLRENPGAKMKQKQTSKEITESDLSI